MKRFLVIILAGLMLFSFAACGNNETPSGGKETDPISQGDLDDLDDALDKLEQMLELSNILCKDFKHVRIDWYNLPDGRVLFGEMTFTPTSGTSKWNPASMNLVMGDMFKLPMQNNKELSNG